MKYLQLFIVAIVCLVLSSTTLRADEEKCAKCHTVNGWKPAAFRHDKTGFLLRGKHARIDCQACHHDITYATPVKQQCADCHRDPHTGELGRNCVKCHNENGWRDDVLGADSLLAHRRTNFPLTGRHALIPCQECHQGARERTFSRVATGCYNCHLQQYQSTATTSVNHVALGFSTKCETCHSPLRWKPAAGFAAHDVCFVISRGPHKSFSCVDCHTSLSSTQFTGTCNGTNFTCTDCHTGAHAQAKMDSEHNDVNGYQYKTTKCYECHNDGSGN